MQGCLVRHAAQGSDGVRVPQPARHRGKRVQLFTRRRGWKQQQKYDVHGLAVDRIEIDRLPKPGQHAKRCLQALHASMRNCNTAPDARGTQLLALKYCIGNALTDRLVAKYEGGELRRAILPIRRCIRMVWTSRFPMARCRTLSPVSRPLGAT
jgi:hypothetical protein